MRILDAQIVMDDTEVACINLRILGNVQPGQRLYTRGLYFSISRNTWLPEFLHRWMSQESREHAMERIRKLVGAVEMLPACEGTRELLRQAKKGLDHLRDTYSGCPTTVAHIDQLQFRIDTMVGEDENEEESEEEM